MNWYLLSFVAGQLLTAEPMPTKEICAVFLNGIEARIEVGLTELDVHKEDVRFECKQLKAAPVKPKMNWAMS